MILLFLEEHLKNQKVRVHTAFPVTVNRLISDQIWGRHPLFQFIRLHSLCLLHLLSSLPRSSPWRSGWASCLGRLMPSRALLWVPGQGTQRSCRMRLSVPGAEVWMTSDLKQLLWASASGDFADIYFCKHIILNISVMCWNTCNLLPLTILLSLLPLFHMKTKYWDISKISKIWLWRWFGYCAWGKHLLTYVLFVVF